MSTTDTTEPEVRPYVLRPAEGRGRRQSERQQDEATGAGVEGLAIALNAGGAGKHVEHLVLGAAVGRSRRG